MVKRLICGGVFKMGYEEDRIKEKEENKKIRDRLKTILETMGYNVVLNDVSIFYNANVNGKKDNQEIHLSTNNYRNKGKIRVSGSYPRDNNNSLVIPNNPTNSINITLNKTDEQIINDINKRFLIGYLNDLKGVEERIKNSNLAKENRDNLIYQLGEKLGIKPYKPQYSDDSIPYLSEYEYKKDIERIKIKSDYKGESATIELRLKKGLVLKFAEWLNKEG